MPSALLTLLRPCAALLVSTCLVAQVPKPTVPVPDPPPETVQSKPMASPDSDSKMTKEQSATLFRSVDDIVAFVSNDTHLKATRPIKRKLLTRAEVAHELARKMNDDEGTKRLERSSLVLKKFGLLDADCELRPFC